VVLRAFSLRPPGVVPQPYGGLPYRELPYQELPCGAPRRTFVQLQTFERLPFISKFVNDP
jgi:hypothetical protein